MIPQPPIHIPVLLAEVIAALAPKDGEIHVDGTFGAGGYSRALLQAAKCRVIAIDRDPSAIARGQAMAQEWDGRLTMVQGCYGDMAQALSDLGITQVDGITLDIGVSSMQIDQAERGFSFAKDGPLDMRMGDDGPTAADLVNAMPEEQLANVIYQYGEERLSRRIARAIVMQRKITPYTRTVELAETVRANVPRSKDGIDPATRTFQALRIAVNDELGELERGLKAAETLLAPGGRLAVVTFHSLEDRMVKDYIKSRSGTQAQPSRHIPLTAAAMAVQPVFTTLQRKPITATADETRRNPRARSARLRLAIRTTAPALGGPA